MESKGASHFLSRRFVPGASEPGIGEIAPAARASPAEIREFRRVLGVMAEDPGAWKIAVNRLKVRGPMVRAALALEPEAVSIRDIVHHLQAMDQLLVDAVNAIMVRAFPGKDEPHIRAGVAAALTFTIAGIYRDSGGNSSSVKLDLILDTHLQPGAAGSVAQYLEPTAATRIETSRFEAITSLVEVAMEDARLLPVSRALPRMVELLDGAVEYLRKQVLRVAPLSSCDDESIVVASLQVQVSRLLAQAHRQGNQDLIRTLKPMTSAQRVSYYREAGGFPYHPIESRFENAIAALDRFAVSIQRPIPAIESLPRGISQ